MFHFPLLSNEENAGARKRRQVQTDRVKSERIRCHPRAGIRSRRSAPVGAEGWGPPGREPQKSLRRGMPRAPDEPAITSLMLLARRDRLRRTNVRAFERTRRTRLETRRARRRRLAI